MKKSDVNKSGGNGSEEDNLVIEKPDGGWGWMVVIGVALTNMTTQSLVSSFGLLFGDWLDANGESTTGAAVIMSVMIATTNLSGLMTGPIIRRFSYRKVALMGGILTSSGIIITSLCSAPWQVILAYSIMSGLGLGLIAPSAFVALNAYFSLKRGRAVGFALAGTGMGQMLMPQAVRALLDEYGFRGAMLILGAVSMHGIAGAALYHPVHWHVKVKEVDKEPDETKVMVRVDGAAEQNGRLNKEVDAEDEVGEIGGDLKRRHSLSPRGDGTRRRSSLTPPPRWMTRKASCVSVSSVNIGQQVEVLTIHSLEDVREVKISEEGEEEEEDKSSACGKFVALMDLDLLSNPVFVNVVVGLALVYSAGINFAMIFPFYLTSIGFSKAETATCMSTLAGADILSRVVLPSITDKIGAGNRMTFLAAMVFLAVFRSVIAELQNYSALLVVSALCGFVRGSTVVNFNLSIAEHCTAKQLPAALGINMVIKGVSILILGPILGWVRDYSGSYSLCIHVPNTLLLFTAATWVAEIMIVHRKEKGSMKDFNIGEGYKSPKGDKTTSRKTKNRHCLCL